MSLLAGNTRLLMKTKHVFLSTISFPMAKTVSSSATDTHSTDREGVITGLVKCILSLYHQIFVVRAFILLKNIG